MKVQDFSAELVSHTCVFPCWQKIHNLKGRYLLSDLQRLSDLHMHVFTRSFKKSTIYRMASWPRWSDAGWNNLLLMACNAFFFACGQRFSSNDCYNLLKRFVYCSTAAFSFVINGSKFFEVRMKISGQGKYSPIRFCPESSQYLPLPIRIYPGTLFKWLDIKKSRRVLRLRKLLSF